MAARQGRQEQGAEDFQGSTTATVCPRRRTLVPTHRTDTSDPDAPCPGAEAPSSRRALTGVPAGGGEAAPGDLILCCPLLLLPSIFPASGSFQMSQLSASGGQSIGVSLLTLTSIHDHW